MKLPGSALAVAILITVTVLGATGCASVGQAIEDLNARIELQAEQMTVVGFEASEDAELVSRLYRPGGPAQTGFMHPDILRAGYVVDRVEPTLVTFQRNSYFAANLEDLARQFSRYGEDTERDGLSVAYIDAALARGSEVRVYRPVLGRRLLRLFHSPSPEVVNMPLWPDRDVVLIEYDRSGRPVSMLYRVHQVASTIGFQARMTAGIYIGGRNMRHLENSMGNRRLEELLLRVIR